MKKVFVSALIVCLSAACLWSAGGRSRFLSGLRDTHGLTEGQALDDAPPLVTFTTVVLGGFRGLIADVLWLRAAHLQDRGRFFELVQLADWITRLEPRSEEIWAFHAWNMVYNVTAMMPDREDRWRWIQNGIGLLRDQGMAYNPSDAALYWELGWIFQHKIGGSTDPDHLYFKTEWAGEMTGLLGAPPLRPERLSRQPGVAERLQTRYRLDLERMAQVDARYGPLDWRLPEPHAIYWATVGREHAGEDGSLDCDRMIFQSLAVLFMSGQLIFQPETGVYERAPDVDLLDAAAAAYESAWQTHGHETIRASHLNFLCEGLLHMLDGGQDAVARDLFVRLQQTFPGVVEGRDLPAFVEALRNAPQSQPVLFR